MRIRLLLAGLLLPVLAACGAETAAPPAVTLKAIDVVRAAGDNTVKAGSARMTMRMEGAGVEMDADGVFAMDGKRGSMTMEMAVAGQTMTMEMRILGDVVYMKMPPELGAPTPWLSLDLEKAAGGNDLAALSQLQQNDPTQALAYLKGVSDDIAEAGKETVRGVETTKYTGTIDFAKAAESQSDPRVKDAIRGVAGKLGNQKAPVTVWIDGEGLIRKMTQTLDMSKVAESGGASGTLTTTIEIYDFGTPVKVSAPPASQVSDGTKLLGGQ